MLIKISSLSTTIDRLLNEWVGDLMDDSVELYGEMVEASDKAVTEAV